MSEKNKMTITTSQSRTFNVADSLIEIEKWVMFNGKPTHIVAMSDNSKSRFFIDGQELFGEGESVRNEPKSCTRSILCIC